MSKRIKPDQSAIELVPDAWAKFEKFVKGIVKAGPQHRPTKPAKKALDRSSMMSPTGDAPHHAIAAAAFAESIANQYEQTGKSARSAFAAFAGLVSVRDRLLAAECLTALDAAVSLSAKGGNASPSA